jgi:hypothetical protein
MDKAFCFDQLYPLQDEVLQLITAEDTEFYLTGGTAASRGYLKHRFSDDLDLFVSDDDRFALWADRVIQALSRSQRWVLTVHRKERRFVRCALKLSNLEMKLEMVNDVRSRVGAIKEHASLGRMDGAENILANKIAALLDREEPKDLADIWGFCCRMGIPLEPAIAGAQGRAAGVFPADLARVLCSAAREDWEVIRWIDPPPAEQFLQELRVLGEQLVL